MADWDAQFKALKELEHAAETLATLRLHLAWARYFNGIHDRERQSKKLERIDSENNEYIEKIETLRVRTILCYTIHVKKYLVITYNLT